MDTQALIARLRERAATQDACGCWSLDKAAADELERLVAIEAAARSIVREEFENHGACRADFADLEKALDGLT